MTDDIARRVARRSLIEVYHGYADPARDVNRLVGFGFRCAMACVSSAEEHDAATACDALNAGLCRYGLTQAATDGFLAWTLAVQCDAARPIVTLPIPSAGFSRDECLAVSLVAACQHPACPALRACAGALLGTQDNARALAATSELATYLLASDKRLPFASIFGAETAAPTTDTPPQARPGRYH
ncbi:MAG: hypothetical protein K2Y05_03025 [Hyphomicrobiaceae bacterium]|nr:hypothetical protein [Hyphomicrobiaceae bacterium]